MLDGADTRNLGAMGPFGCRFEPLVSVIPCADLQLSLLLLMQSSAGAFAHGSDGGQLATAIKQARRLLVYDGGPCR